MLLIVVTEGDPKREIDWKYIKSFLDYRYGIRNKVKLKSICLASKSKFQTALPKIQNEISRFFKMRPGSSEPVVVCLCFDTDYGAPAQEQNQRIEEFARAHGYRLAWMHRDVEEVFLGRRIPDKEKVRASDAFVNKQGIASVGLHKLLASKFDGAPYGVSNIAVVFDELLGEPK